MRRLARRLALEGADRSGVLADAGERWVRAWALGEGTGLLGTDEVSRQVTVEPGLDAFLAGAPSGAPSRLGRLVRRLLEPELHPLLPAIRAALAQAGDQAVDEVVWLEELHDQHRDVLFSPWGQVGRPCYPAGPGDAGVPYDDDGLVKIEGRLAEEALAVCARVGLLRRAPGAFAATAAGLAWAGVPPATPVPIWVASDLEVVVPPGALDPAERAHLERFSRCTSRDVVDRYRLERGTLADWLRTRTLAEAEALLRAHAPALPPTVTETLASWGRSLQRVVLVHGVLLDALPGDRVPAEEAP